MLSAVLMLSQAVVSFADTQGKMDPDDYLFLTVFRTCGVSPGVDVGRWVGLYKGYLKSTGNQALLSQVEGYASLNWGDTAQGVDALLVSVKEWLSLSDSYGTNVVGYNLPSSPAPQIKTASYDGERSILTSPFPDLSLDSAGYSYSFSFITGNYIDNSLMTYRHNCYFPDTAKMFGIVTSLSMYNYSDLIGVKYYKASDLNYVQQWCDFVYGAYYPDGSVYVSPKKSSVSTGYFPSCAVMNLPFPVFKNESDALEYCKTGVVNNAFTHTSGFLTSLGEESGFDSELQRKEFISVSNSLTLPKSLDEATAKVKEFQKPLNHEELMTVLNENGMNIIYSAKYRVEHLREIASSGSDSEQEWEKYSEETFYGAPGSTAVFTPLELEGYTYVPELTEPEEKGIPADESLVIRLYYTLDRAPYVVEHYTQRMMPGEGGEKWELAGAETFQGIPGMLAEYQARDYSGYTFDGSLTEPSDCQILSDGSLVVRLYYTLDQVSYTVEHYTQRMIPGEGGEKWELADTETFQGIPGTEAVYQVKDYSGYVFDNSLTEPSDCQVLSDGSLVVRLYYVQAPFSVLTEPINKAVGAALPVAAVIGSVFSGGLFLLKLYKRISAKA